MKTKRLLLTAVIGAGLACGVAAQVRQQPGEMVEMKSLPSSVQQAINQKTAGGEIVRVKMEDDANGRWNYEVVVRSQGKEWGFEVDRIENSSGPRARKDNREQQAITRGVFETISSLVRAGSREIMLAWEK
jgi:hypothetical protein